MSFVRIFAFFCGLAFASTLVAHPRQRDVDIASLGIGSVDAALVLPNGNIAICHSRFGGSGVVDGIGAVWLLRPDGSVVSKLTGSQPGDRVCGLTPSSFVNLGATAGLFLLPDGNFLVVSPRWRCAGGALDCGAVTWMDANRGLGPTAEVGYHNSLVGSAAGDNVGSKVWGLANGDYVVASRNRSIGADGVALTLAHGLATATGTPTTANSWTAAGASLDELIGGDRFLELPGGDLVISTSHYVTHIRRDQPFRGTVSAANSLDVAGDPGDSPEVSLQALTGGNYVVCNPAWNAGRGAATWVDARRPLTGVSVNASNSLVGRRSGDGVCSRGVTPLFENGNYVVISPSVALSTPATGPVQGAVTWGSGSRGVAGALDATNSFLPLGKSGEYANAWITPLQRNGNFVINCSNCMVLGDSAATAPVVWADGTRAIVGYPTPANAQYAKNQSSYPRCEEVSVTGLANGNYVIVRPGLKVVGRSEIGAANWANGASGGPVGDVQKDRTLWGIRGADAYWYSEFCPGAVPLPKGDFLVRSFLDNRGGITWAAGDRPLGSVASAASATVVSAANSLVGGSPGMVLGRDLALLTNGNYVAPSASPEGLTYYGGFTWGSGAGGTIGSADRSNTVISEAYGRYYFTFPLRDGRFVTYGYAYSGSTLGDVLCEYSGAGPVSGGPTEEYCVADKTIWTFAEAPSGQFWATVHSDGSGGYTLTLVYRDGIFSDGFGR